MHGRRRTLQKRAEQRHYFIRTERAKLGVGVGVHAADLKLEVSGKVYAGNLKTDLGSGNEDLLAPLPNVYVMGAYCFGDYGYLRLYRCFHFH